LASKAKEFKAKGAVLVAISNETIEDQKSMQKSKEFSAFEFIGDANGVFSTKYSGEAIAGVVTPGLAVFDSKGNVLFNQI
jgi:peroxiredoxin